MRWMMRHKINPLDTGKFIGRGAKGDVYRTNNVFLQKNEPLLNDMDRLSTGHPIAEISDLYYFYVVLGEDDPTIVENFMGFSYETAGQFFRFFLKHYLGTEDEDRLREVTEKASLLSWSRAIRQLYKKRSLSDRNREMIERYTGRIRDLAERYETLTF